MKRTREDHAGNGMQSPPSRPSQGPTSPGFRLLALIGVTILAGPATALDSWNIDFVGSLPGYLHRVEVAEGHAYCATESGLLVLDVATGGDPIQVAFLPLQGVTGIAIEGGRAYLTAGQGSTDGTLVIVDISNPSRPVPVGHYDGCYSPVAIVVHDALAYVADSYRGLRVIDVHDPAVPEQIGYLPTTRPLGGLDLVASLIYLADAGDGLRIIDVSDPANPVQIGRYDPGYDVRDVVVDGDHAFIACSPGIQVVDVSDPRAPFQAASYTCPQVDILAWRKEHLYLSHFESLRVLDVRDPHAPIETCLIGVLGRTRNVAFAGDSAYVAASHGGLRVLDLQAPGNPIEVSSFFLLGDAYGLNLKAGQVYLAGGHRVSDQFRGARERSASQAEAVGGGVGDLRDVSTAGLYVVDLVDPSKPRIRSWSAYGNALDVALRDSFACVSDWNGRLGVFTVADPNHPAEIGWGSTGYWTTDLDMDARYAYVLIEYDLLIFDLIDPTNPVLVGSVRAGTTAIDVQGDYAYLLDSYWGLSIVDVSDPHTPQVLGRFDMENWAEGLAVEGDYVYVANGALGLRVIDVRQPLTPIEVGAHDTPGFAVAVAVDGDRAYVADQEGGVRVFDVSDPSVPTEIAYFVTTTPAQDVAIDGATIVAGCSGGGIFVLRNRIPADANNAETAHSTVVLEQNRPNPAVGATQIRFSVPSERPVRFAVFSSDGRLVVKLVDRSVASGTHTVRWSGCDHRGRPVPSGTYFYRLEAGEDSKTRRLTLIRAGNR